MPVIVASELGADGRRDVKADDALPLKHDDWTAVSEPCHLDRLRDVTGIGNIGGARAIALDRA